MARIGYVLHLVEPAGARNRSLWRFVGSAWSQGLVESSLDWSQRSDSHRMIGCLLLGAKHAKVDIVISATETDGVSWSSYRQRFESGEWRATVFRDMILDDLSQMSIEGPVRMLDIGCGKGFDDSRTLQQSLAERADSYIGVEPDPDICLGNYFSEVHRRPFEEAELERGSVQLAHCVMVLEHISNPVRFWQKLEYVLATDGVFWGFTVDSRHYFAFLSSWAERLGLKNWYLTKLLGQKGGQRYTNYPTYYRANSPRRIQPLVENFREFHFESFGRVAQCAFYLPRSARLPFRWLNILTLKLGLPGSVAAVRLLK